MSASLTQYGPGDAATFPAYDPAAAFACNDPRAPEPDDTTSGLQFLMEDAQDGFRKAEKLIADGNLQGAIDLMRSIGRDLVGADWA